MANKDLLLDFEVEEGKNVIKVQDLKRCFDYFPRCSPHRVYLLLLYLSLRPAEPMQLTWDNFTENGILIFRPEKTGKKVVRKIKIPPLMWEEIKTYRDTNYFAQGKLFPFTHGSFRRRFNKDFRAHIGHNWNKRGSIRGGCCPQFYHYTLSCFRTTVATMVYYYYSQVFGAGDLALSKTSRFMGHSSKFTTADYYIKRVSKLGLDKCPSLSYLELVDYIVYGEVQLRLREYIKERQGLLMEY